jgi:hypothetical protein
MQTKLEFVTDPRTALGVLEALEAVTRPYAAPETVDAYSALEYLIGLRDAWRPRLSELRHAVMVADAEIEALF